MARSKEDILKLIDENEIKYIRLWFTDILGRLKGMSITRSEIEAVLDHGQGFDGSSIEGFVRIEESDLNAIADLVTEMREIKHYYRDGVDARDGIEN